MLYERIAILAAAGIVALIAYVVWRAYAARRVERLAEAAAPASVRELVVDAAPAVLYFTTSNCAQCRFQQKPALDRFAEQARVAVYAVDAVAQEELARFYGIMTVPSTVLLNARLQPVAINHGLASADRLVQQLRAAAP